MNSLFGRFAGLVALSLAGSMAAHAATLVLSDTNPVTGHYYEVYAQNNITWSDANTAAQALSHDELDENGDVVDSVRGHLVTITSEAEDLFVDDLRQRAFSPSLSPRLTQPQVWIGGYQPSCTPEPGCGWKWVDEGADLTEPGQPFPGANTGPAYSNWASARGEPNNSGGNESGATLGRYHPERSWNDEGAAVSSIGGYIVEYDRPLQAKDCSVQAGGCETIQGQLIEFPSGSIEEGDKIGFIPFEFTDPRVAAGQCGVESLRLFADDPDPDNDLIIPPYLCGSPKFVAVRVDSDDLSITSGTVLVENFTETVLPGNVYPDGTVFGDAEDAGGSGRNLCQDPIPAGVDPQYQDIVVWQTTNPAKMREDGSSVDPQFVGNAGEFTDSCGSSRAKVAGASYFVVGMHIDFGPGNTWAGNAAGNHARFIALTRYKLELLRASIKEARDSGALVKNGDYNKMDSMVVNAIKFLDVGDYAGALDKVDNFVKFITPALYKQPPPTSDVDGKPLNYEGEHISRSSNIAFMLRVKVIPYAGP